MKFVNLNRKILIIMIGIYNLVSRNLIYRKKG